jgi:NCS1 family nucleobase:cation symporter-1
VHAIFSMRGRYGLVNWKAIATYAVAVIAEIPFMSCALFVGPLATALGGVDIAWVVGLLVAGVVHYVLNRSAAAEDTDLAVPPVTATAAATA